MRRGRLFILLALVILAVVVVVVVVVSMGGIGGPAPTGGAGGEAPRAGAQPTATPIPLTCVVVSTQNLPRGFRIPRDALDIVLWPTQSGVQENAFVLPFEQCGDGQITPQEKEDFLNPVSNPTSPVGQVVRTSIVRWQPVLQSMVVRDLAAAAEDVGSQTSAILPSGYVAVSVPIDIISGVAYAINDGDRVDVIISFLFVDVDEEFQSISPNIQTLVTIAEDGSIGIQAGVPGRFEPGSILGVPVIIEPTEFQRPRLVTQRTIQNALVIHVGEYPIGRDFLKSTVAEAAGEPTPAPQVAAAQEGPTPIPTATPPRPSIITLAVQPQEAVVLVWAIESQIPITLALRSAADRLAGAELTQPVSLEYMVANYQVTRPARLEYALEPRITEVRSINALLRDQNLINFVDSTAGRSRGAGGQ